MDLQRSEHGILLAVYIICRPQAADLLIHTLHFCTTCIFDIHYWDLTVNRTADYGKGSYGLQTTDYGLGIKYGLG